MCESIVIGQRMIETVGEARLAMPAGLVFDADADRQTPPTETECLCWLDMEATARLNGYTANNQHGGDPFEWIFTKQKAQE